MIQKLRGQLLVIFLLFGGINVLFIIGYLIQEQHRTNIEIIEDYTHQIQVYIQDDAKNINDFFTYETRRPDFFTSQNSEYLDNHKNLVKQLSQIQINLSKQAEFQKMNGDSLIHSITIHIDSLNLTMDSITRLIYDRGFKDFGIEGKMRVHAHNLENMPNVMLSDLLMLRRHEKDYIIRNETKYINKFNERMAQIQGQIQSNNSLIKSKQQLILKELNQYGQAFYEMVRLDQKIGIKSNDAIKAILESEINCVLADADLLNTLCHNYKDKTYKQYRNLSILILLLIISFSVWMSFKLSKLVTHRISLLSDNISKFINSCFTEITPVRVVKKDDEVGLLIENFELLKQKISDQLNYLEVKVAERTEEINSQKEQILEQNMKLMDSLRYALNIQEAVLPHKDYISQAIPEHFVFFRPKDLVSGDFYWYKHISKKNKDISVIAVADCTGHGIPGAFMSMLGIAFLTDVVSANSLKNSGKLLNKLREKVLDNLAQRNNTKIINDGMDIALVIIDHKARKLQFSGAYRDLVIIRNGELNIIKGNRMPIGKHINSVEDFSSEEISYELNDTLYLFTDGFADQQGGPKIHKYLRKNLKSFLSNLSYFPMNQQKLLVEQELNQWMGKLDQTDDILLSGFKLTH